MRASYTTSLFRVAATWAAASGFVFAQNDDQTARTIENGRHILQVLLAEDTERSPGDVHIRVDPHTWKSSTELFQKMLASHQIPSPVLFLAPGLPAATNSLRPENNPWCLNMSAFSDNAKRVPALFTRNLHFRVVQGKVHAYLTDELPYGKAGALIIMNSGRPEWLNEEDITKMAGRLHAQNVEELLRP